MKRLEKKFLTATLTLGVLLSTQTIYAFEDRPDRPEMHESGSDVDVKTRVLERLDTDGDGQISEDEARGGMAENFSKHDLDEDGYISTDEEFETLPKHPPRRGEKKENTSDESQSE